LESNNLVSLLLAPLAAFVTWILTRKKQSADISVSISEAAQTSVESLILVMDELKSKIEDSTSEIALLKVRTEELILENELLRMELEELKQQNTQLLEDNSKLRIDIHRLTNQLESMQ
jgi:regulator of replication initiation timing